MSDIKPELIEKSAQAIHDMRSRRSWAFHEIGQPLGGTVCDGERRADARAALEAVADDLRAEGAAEALHAALYDLEVTQSSHDVAECAAPVPGEVGRQDAIDEWVSICEEPVEWMRKFAQRYAHEAPSDAYIREVEEEARAEGAAKALRERLPCDGGCNYNDGLMETCSRHGRPVAEVWELVDVVQADAWDEGHRTPQQREMDDCHCYAHYAGECACGRFGTGRIITPNPYRQEARDE